jgi:hypothetical protein
VSVLTNPKVEDLSQSLGYRITDLEQQGDDSENTISRILQNHLDSDDKLLSSLQKLGWELKQQDPEEGQRNDELRDICMRYVRTLQPIDLASHRCPQIHQEHCGNSADKVGQDIP